MSKNYEYFEIGLVLNEGDGWEERVTRSEQMEDASVESLFWVLCAYPYRSEGDLSDDPIMPDYLEEGSFKKCLSFWQKFTGNSTEIDRPREKAEYLATLPACQESAS